MNSELYKYTEINIQYSLLSWHSGKSLCCSAHGLYSHEAQKVRSSTPGPGGLLVHAGQLSAYSEINISGKHRGFDSVLFNLWLLANAGFRDARY